MEIIIQIWCWCLTVEVWALLLRWKEFNRLFFSEVKLIGSPPCGIVKWTNPFKHQLYFFCLIGSFWLLDLQVSLEESHTDTKTSTIISVLPLLKSNLTETKDNLLLFLSSTMMKGQILPCPQGTFLLFSEMGFSLPSWVPFLLWLSHWDILQWTILTQSTQFYNCIRSYTLKSCYIFDNRIILTCTLLGKIRLVQNYLL